MKRLGFYFLLFFLISCEKDEIKKPFVYNEPFVGNYSLNEVENLEGRQLNNKFEENDYVIKHTLTYQGNEGEGIKTVKYEFRDSILKQVEVKPEYRVRVPLKSDLGEKYGEYDFETDYNSWRGYTWENDSLMVEYYEFYTDERCLVTYRIK